MSFRTLALVCLASLLGYGQGSSGEIRLEVMDDSGANVEASGSIQGLATGVHREFRTDEKGLRTFTELPYGIYRIDVARPGFAPQSVRVNVRSEVPVTETVTLRVAALETSVVVRELETLVNPE